MSADNSKDGLSITVENKPDDSQASQKSPTKKVELSKDDEAETSKDDLNDSQEEMNVDEERDVIESEEGEIAEPRKDVVEATKPKDSTEVSRTDETPLHDEDVDMEQAAVKPVEDEVKETVGGEDETEMDVAAIPEEDKDEGSNEKKKDNAEASAGTSTQSDADKETTPMVVDDPKEVEVVMVEKDKEEESSRRKNEETHSDQGNVDMLAIDESNDKNNVNETIEVMDVDNISPSKSKSSSEPVEDPFMTDSDDLVRNSSQTTTTTIESSSLEEHGSNKDTLSQDSAITDEHSIFVQDNNDKDDSDKSAETADQISNEVDPIGSTEWTPGAESTDNTFASDLDEADECIIPDASKDESTPISSSQESELSTPAASLSTDSDSMRLCEKYLVSVVNTTEKSSCMICKEEKVCKYNCVKDTDTSSLCSEECLNKLKKKHSDNVIVRKLRVKNFSTDLRGTTDTDATGVTPPVTVIGNIRCKNCNLLISDSHNSLSWEAFDFCNENCLTKHQKVIGAFCANCKIEVKDNFLGKYCVRFGFSVRQFCSSTCLEQYKKNARVCSYCQNDIHDHSTSLTSSVHDKGVVKDFCSNNCTEKYNDICRFLRGPKLIDECCVCHKNNTIEMEFNFKGKINFFCGEPCFVAFKYVNDVAPEKCDMCCRYFVSQPSNDTCLIRYDGTLRKFCQKSCQNIYITTNRKIVSCCWCKVKKYNFDMIQKYTPDNIVLIICSLTCLNFFNASLNATKVKKKRCDYCHKICKGQYHITLADDSMKNFCSYPCVQDYQNKYILTPARYTEPAPPQPPPVVIPPTTTTSCRVTRKSSSMQQRKQIIPDVPGPLPIITSVRSLAPVTPTVSTRSTRSKSSGSTITTITTLQETPALPSVRRIVLVRPPDLPVQKNVATLVKPITCDVEAEMKPVMVDKAVQTEDIKDSLVLLPVPVPIYIPQPIEMFNLVYPVPIPFPLPIPVPIFIPVTKQTSSVVLKELKKNQVRTPRDPYEADLLMMAELVAGENEKKEEVESEAEPESEGDHAPEPSFSPEPQDASNTFGDDMLQMALKMASDFEEPAVDLEGALTANTITATAGNSSSEQVDDVVPITPPVERSTFRGRRRGRAHRHGGRGRGRGRPPTRPEVVLPVEPEPQPPPEPVEKPDANMCLKYTFGVNAWKQWVTTKNADLEKSFRRAKPFKSDLLQLTSDELNYSLCLFVKEVRKPNGAEYAPDTIYYLCLGIQQYLYENGRIDNIFCDSYYDSFTDCLDEVCKKFSTLYNDSQYIVTRVEEEHLWESKQLGAHSPHVLLSTLMFFNTKHFNLTNVDEHMQLSFSHIMKHWKRVPNQPGTPKNASSRNILLRFYPPQSAVGNKSKKKVYEQQENDENPLRCPVKLYEFYLSKCPESVKTRNDVFYLLPERSCVPDSPVWYSTMALGKDALEKMLHRVKMVKEINVALLAS
ncbi:zinc finger mym-type protein [Holotrichia oblita]|uniref:Zinc finger mym-type protein n=1 Tax=Holotrichia oblita TaxID=644536 RepID=A0ACB9SFN8_HOLOL|nr:zinc finger mym-type protein [Holotrichia oblita]